MRVGGELIGVISAFSTGIGFFRRRHQTLLEGFADQAGIAIHNARLFEESQRRGRERQALLEAGHAVNQSLDVGETIRLILEQAREVKAAARASASLDQPVGEAEDAVFGDFVAGDDPLPEEEVEVSLRSQALTAALLSL